MVGPLVLDDEEEERSGDHDANGRGSNGVVLDGLLKHYREVNRVTETGLKFRLESWTEVLHCSGTHNLELRDVLLNPIGC